MRRELLTDRLFTLCLITLLAGFLVSGCTAARTITPAPEIIFQDVTRIVEITSTPQTVEVTRVVNISQMVEVTAAPTPGLADDCYQKAETQLAMDECAVIEYGLAVSELETAIAQVIKKLTPEEQANFKQIQAEWQTQVERDCKYFYGQTMPTVDGGVMYKNGSMAPMLVQSCKTGMVIDRTEEIKNAFLFFQ